MLKTFQTCRQTFSLGSDLLFDCDQPCATFLFPLKKPNTDLYLRARLTFWLLIHHPSSVAAGMRTKL